MISNALPSDLYSATLKMYAKLVISTRLYLLVVCPWFTRVTKFKNNYYFNDWHTCWCITIITIFMIHMRPSARQKLIFSWFTWVLVYDNDHYFNDSNSCWCKAIITIFVIHMRAGARLWPLIAITVSVFVDIFLKKYLHTCFCHWQNNSWLYISWFYSGTYSFMYYWFLPLDIWL